MTRSGAEVWNPKFKLLVGHDDIPTEKGPNTDIRRGHEGLAAEGVSTELRNKILDETHCFKTDCLLRDRTVPP
jgi:hypothetical protein